ncbi:MAG: hypothetical protein AAFX94_11910, partial [Myxococcota bacterium]
MVRGFVMALLSVGCAEQVVLFDSPPESVTLAPSQQHTVALVEGGLVGWGSNAAGQLGALDGDAMVQDPIPIDAGPWEEVHAGRVTTCAVDSQAQVFCRGGNEFGQLGIGDTVDRDFFVQVPLPQPVAKFVTRYSHSFALLVTGELWVWGRNTERQADPTNFENVLTPQRFDDQQWRDIAPGQGHSCGIADDGSLYCWGRNNLGQCGVGEDIPNTLPTRVDLPGPALRVEAEQNHSCVRLETGELWCFGANEFGELGDGTAVDRFEPVRSAAGDEFVAVDLGTFNTEQRHHKTPDHGRKIAGGTRDS